MMSVGWSWGHERRMELTVEPDTMAGLRHGGQGGSPGGSDAPGAFARACMTAYLGGSRHAIVVACSADGWGWTAVTVEDWP
jgi:hypothetical protein